MQEAQRLINVIRQAIEQHVGTVGRSNFRYGTIYEGGSGAYASAYLSGDDEPTEELRLISGTYVTEGDPIIAIVTPEGDAWVDQILPVAEYAKMAIDFNNGKIYLGDGVSPPIDSGSPGQALRTDTNGYLYWGD